jgi:ABC-type multidrug transport system ATPase subunit
VNTQVSGNVLYNGKAFNEFVVERTAAYVDQHDQHLAVLTVQETLEFAHACSGSKPDFLSWKELNELQYVPAAPDTKALLLQHSKSS